MCAIIMPCYCDSGSDCSKLISFHYIEALPILAVFPVNETGLQIKLYLFFRNTSLRRTKVLLSGH